MKPFRAGRIALAAAFIAFGPARALSGADHTAKVYETASVVANQPMGEAKGIYPGRVVWVHDPTAVNQDCVVDAPGHGWFLSENNNQAVIDGMVSIALHNLAGQNSDGAAWDAIFRFHNAAVGKGSVGYAKGEKVFIKINATSAWNGNFNPVDLTPYAFITETSVGPVLSVLRQLVNVVGVDQTDIYVGDPLKHIYKHLYDVWHGEFPDVHYLDNGGYESLGRESVVASTTAVIHYSDRGAVLRTNVWSDNYPGDDPVYQDYLYTIFEDAEYLINIPMLKGHMRAGMTLFAKNHFGSQTRADASHLHNGLVAPTEMPNVSRGGYGLYRVQVDIMGHSLLGRKNLFFLLDALWGTDYELDVPLRWQMAPFANSYSASVFASLDPVAIESVGYDFLRSEFTADRVPAAGTYVQMPGVDDYLHQAADPENWPGGIEYDPDDSGVPLQSLGTHEHWNNASDKQYSRNLDPAGAGIELILASQNTRTELVAGQTAAPGGAATFTVVAIGATPLSYQWQRQAAGSTTWSNLSDGPTYSSSATSTLAIAGATLAMNGDYFRCVVGNGASPGATSNAAELQVLAVPTILVMPASATVGTGARVVFSVVATSANGVSYQWSRNGADIAGATAAELALSGVTPANAGSYAVVVRDALGGSVVTVPATLTVGIQPYAPPGSTLINIATRAQVGTGADLMIAGFVVGGSGSKKVLIRAVGPSLTNLDPVNLTTGVVLADPALQLTKPDGTQLLSNEGWGDDPAIAAAAAAAGGFALQAGSKDAAMIATLPPGPYTALVSGKNGASGVALVEVYDLDTSAASRLINISTRAQVGTGAQSLIAGFVIAGSAPRNVLIRAIGPSLTALDPVNLPAGVVLPDPQLALQIPGGPVLSSNDDWNSSNGAAIAAAASAVGAFALVPSSKDSALLSSLNAGPYTPVITGKAGAVGIALVEVYEAP
jgi:hypothetical protein